jgi:tetratricopeptide (TPR) repeat protein
MFKVIITFYWFLIQSGSTFPIPFCSHAIHTVVRTLITPLILNSLDVQTGEAVQTGESVTTFIRPLLQKNFKIAQVNIPYVMSTLHPLPQEELRLYWDRGDAYLMLGDFDNALMSYNQAEELIPETRGIKEGNQFYINRGTVNEKLLKWEDAIVDFEKANLIFKKSPFANDDPTSIYNIANAETGLLQWENALRDFTRAAKLKSDLLEAQIGRALVLYQLNRPEETFQYFKTIAVKYPYFPDGQAVLAAIYFEKGDIKTANDCYENAIEEDPRYDDLDWVLNIRYCY